MQKRIPLLNLIVILSVLLFPLFFAGCSGKTDNDSTIGNGKVDQVEAASIRVAVGLAFAARPDTVAPAYAASTAILAMIGSEQAEPVSLAVIDGVIDEEVVKLDIDPTTRLAFLDLVALVKARVMEQLGSEDDIAAKLVVARDVVQIIQQAAAARMVMQ